MPFPLLIITTADSEELLTQDRRFKGHGMMHQEALEHCEIKRHEV